MQIYNGKEYKMSFIDPIEPIGIGKKETNPSQFEGYGANTAISLRSPSVFTQSMGVASADVDKIGEYLSGQ